jgi:hypothetical protein
MSKPYDLAICASVSPAAPNRFSALIIAQLALAPEFDAGGPKRLDKASTVRKTMSGEHQNTPQTAR